jgi:5'-3' exonuclease
MNFTQEQFIDLCILSGTDYVATIPKVGAKTAFSLINEHISIENIIKQNSKYELPENYLEKVVGAR